MSSGDGHRRPNSKHPAELGRLERKGGYPELATRWQGIDDNYDIPDLAGYNVAGTIVYLDRDFLHALLDPDYARQILGEEINTGLSPEDTIAAVVRHEQVEKNLMASDNQIDVYEPAHQLATCAEHQLVREKKGKPVTYERGLKKIIKYCEKKPVRSAPSDLAAAPYLDETDAPDKRVVKELIAAGVLDAAKQSKLSQDYTKSTGEDQCQGCANWQPAPDFPPNLALCAKVAGQVRTDRWCRLFEAAPQESGQESGQEQPNDPETLGR